MLTTGMTYFVSLAPPAERGRYAGAFLFCYMIAQSATPPLMLGLQDALGSREAAVVAAGVLATTTCVWLLTSRPLRRAVVVEPMTAAYSET
jgi:MFS family permease